MKFLLKRDRQTGIKSSRCQSVMDKRSVDRCGKKVYETPALVAYGTVWQLTQKVGPNGNPDSPRPGFRNKTHA